MPQLKENKEAKKPLSAEQKEFCLGVAKGLAPKAAYIKAFDCKESAASASASRMLKRANIQAEINRLRLKTHEVHAARIEGRVERALWSKAERMEKLQTWADKSVENGDIPTAIKCVDTLNKMDGAYQPKQDETQGAQQVQVSPEQMKLWAQQIEAARQKVREQAREKGLPTAE